MPSRLPDNYKSLVIQEWLNGEQRDKIAVDNGLGAGSVTNIVNEWRAALGFPTADALRELTVTLRRIGITAAQCALGFRIATLMLRIGVKEDSFESFISDVYNRCKDIGLSPQDIAFHMTDLLEFSQTVPLSKIPDYLKEKTTEKGKLEEEIEKLRAQIETLREQKEDAELLRDTALEDARITSFRLKWYTDLSEELRKYGIPVHDISKLVELVNNIRQYDYDVKKVINEFSNVDDLEDNIRYLDKNRHDLEEKLQNLKSEIEKHEHMRFKAAISTTILNELILMQLDQIQSVSGFVEFGPLGKAARGQKVPKNALKNAVIKAMDILIGSDPTDRSVPTLNMTKSILQNDIRESGVISSPTK